MNIIECKNIKTYSTVPLGPQHKIPASVSPRMTTGGPGVNLFVCAGIQGQSRVSVRQSRHCLEPGEALGTAGTQHKASLCHDCTRFPHSWWRPVPLPRALLSQSDGRSRASRRFHVVHSTQPTSSCRRQWESSSCSLAARRSRLPSSRQPSHECVLAHSKRQRCWPLAFWPILFEENLHLALS